MLPALLACALLLPAAEEATPVAMVLKVGGAVTLQRGEGKGRLAPGDKLLPGDRLSVPAAAELAGDEQNKEPTYSEINNGQRVRRPASRQ